MGKRLRAWFYGMGSVIDLMPAPRRKVRPATPTTEEALRSDFEAVGRDLQTAIDAARLEHRLDDDASKQD